MERLKAGEHKKVRKVFLLTGFSNWGKTTLIYDLFKYRRFQYDQLYPYAGHMFCVQSQSNDDLGRQGYERIMNKRIAALAAAGRNPTHIMTAFCPTREPDNESIEIIRGLYSADAVHVIAIKYKWCLHAELIIPEIEKYYSSINNVSLHVLAERDIKNKKQSLDGLLSPLL